MSSVFDFLLLAWAWAVFSVTVVAALRSRRLRRDELASGDPSPLEEPSRAEWAFPASILVVRPCSGVESGLASRLVDTAAFVAGARARVVVAVEAARDPAFPVAEAAVEVLRARGVDAHVVITHARGPNRKAGQLARVVSLHAAGVVVSIDSDVELGDLRLHHLIDPMIEEDAALTWVPPVELVRNPTIGDRLMAAVLGGSLHAFTLLAGLDPQGLVGKVFAMRRTALDSIGGFDALTTYLGEDVELGCRLLAIDAKIVAVPRVVHARAEGRTLEQTVTRLARWLAVVRAQRPWLLASYPILFFATLPIAVATCANWRLGGSFAPVVLVVGARILAAFSAERFVNARTRRTAFAWAWATDLVLCAAFVVALWRRRVVWRGRSLDILPNGELRDAA